MKSEKEFQSLKEEYMNIPIPKELDMKVQDAIKLGLKRRRKHQMKWVKILTSTAAAMVLVVNISPTFAATLSEVPVIGPIIKVINLREYQVEGERHEAHIKVPQVEGLGNEVLQGKMNEKLQAEADRTYEEFLEMAKEWEDVDSAAHYSMDMNYEVITDTENLFVLKVDKVETIAAANQEVTFYVIDKKNETGLTLQTLFKDETYIPIISDYVIAQMKIRMEEDSSKMYWLNEDDIEMFKAIDANQKFYINQDGKLVIYFDKYEVGPGSTGASEFVIPTELIADLLVDNTLIK